MRGCSRGVCVVAPGGGGLSWLLPWGACMVAPGGHVWLLPGGHAWQRGGMRGKGGACVAKRGMHGEGGHAWQRGVHGKGGVCMAKGDMRGEGGACVVCTAGHCAGGTHPTGMHSCFTSCFADPLKHMAR